MPTITAADGIVIVSENDIEIPKVPVTKAADSHLTYFSEDHPGYQVKTDTENLTSQEAAVTQTANTTQPKIRMWWWPNFTSWFKRIWSRCQPAWKRLPFTGWLFSKKLPNPPQKGHARHQSSQSSILAGLKETPKQVETEIGRSGTKTTASLLFGRKLSNPQKPSIDELNEQFSKTLKEAIDTQLNEDLIDSKNIASIVEEWRKEMSRGYNNDTIHEQYIEVLNRKDADSVLGYLYIQCCQKYPISEAFSKYARYLEIFANIGENFYLRHNFLLFTWRRDQLKSDLLKNMKRFLQHMLINKTINIGYLRDIFSKILCLTKDNDLYISAWLYEILAKEKLISDEDKYKLLTLLREGVGDVAMDGPDARLKTVILIIVFDNLKLWLSSRPENLATEEQLLQALIDVISGPKTDKINAFTPYIKEHLKKLQLQPQQIDDICKKLASAYNELPDPFADYKKTGETILERLKEIDPENIHPVISACI